MGLTNIEVWDRDTIEPHNLPNQFYRLQDIRKHKSTSLADIINNFVNMNITVNTKHYKGEKLEGIVISAVDSLNARAKIWNHIKNNKKIKYYIDTRMGGNLIQIFIVNPNIAKDIELYETSLYPNPKQLLNLPCTGRTILYNILVISGLATNFITKLLKEEECPRKIIFDLKTLMLYKEGENVSKK